MQRWFFTLASLVSLGVLAGHAQQPAPPPPKVLLIAEENVKVGREPAHEKLESNWARAWAAAKWPRSIVAMRAIAGAPQAWFVTGYESMDALQKGSQAEEKHAFSAQNDALLSQDAENVSSTRTIIAAYRDGDEPILIEAAARRGTSLLFNTEFL